VTVLLLYCVVISPWFLLSYYMQTVLGYGPLRTGLGFLPQAVVIAVTSNVTSRLVSRHDPRAALVAGPLLAVAGLLVMWRARSKYIESSPWPRRSQGSARPTTLLALGLALTKKTEVSCQPPNWPLPGTIWWAQLGSNQ
jgi:hypothetical protein